MDIIERAELDLLKRELNSKVQMGIGLKEMQVQAYGSKDKQFRSI